MLSRRPFAFYRPAFGKEAIMLESIILFLLIIVALWLFLKMLLDMLRT
jgi:hypothetical protein